MRRCDIITGILLILSIIDFALAAPVLGKEKHQARVDVVHMPKDLTTVGGKRWEEELDNLGEKYFKTSEKSIDSSGTYSPSSTAPSGPDLGSTNVVQPPAPNLASSAANPESLMESSCPPSCSLSTSSMHGLSARGPGICFGCLRLLEFANGVFHGLFGDRLHVEGYEPSDYSSDSDYELYVPPRNPNNPNLRPPSADPNFDWDNWRNAEDSPRLKLASPEEDSEGSQSHGGSSPPDYEVAPGPPSSPNHMSLSTASSRVNLIAAISAVKDKGKAKTYEYISLFHPGSDESDNSDW